MTTPISHETKLYAVKDCKIAPLTSDPSGGTPVYGVKVDVPGIKTVGISGNMDTKQLRGDNRLLDSQSKITGITIKVDHAKMSLDALALMLGGTVTDVTTAPESASWDLTADSAPAYWMLEAASPTNGGDTIGGDVHFTLWKCSLSKFPELGFAEEDYQIVSFEADCIPLASNGKWLTPTINATATAITA